MTDSERELVKRLRGKIDSLVPRAIAAMFEVQDVVSAVNALEAAWRERDEARADAKTSNDALMRHSEICVGHWEEIALLREATISVTASLEAAISLLERGGKAAKKAAPSDKMFDQMIADYKRSTDIARAALEAKHD